MENLSHSRHQASKFSSKPCNVNMEAARTMHDNVYGGPTKFGLSALSPRVEDYAEIFGSFSRASSIPVLDLPAVDEAEVFFDVRSSGFDYSEVFGDFDGSDYAASYEELIGQSNGGGGNDSCEEASWIPAETESMSEESDHSEKNSRLSYEDPYQFIEGSTEFGISYHKANQISKEDMSIGLTHTSQLHTVPRFACVVDEMTHLEKIESENPSLMMTDDGNFDMDFTKELMGRQFMKTMSHQPHDNANSQTFGNDPMFHRENGLRGSNSNVTFVTVSEISLRTDPSHLPPPSRPPPALYVKKGDSNAFTNTSEETAGDSSPPYFDVEVDATSSAAVSAAAMKEAMVKAQARLKSAKELMERKKEGFQGRKKPGSKNGIEAKEVKTNKNVNESGSLNFESIQGSVEREDRGINKSLREERQKLVKVTEAVPQSSREELLNSAKGFAEGKHVNASWSSEVSAKVDGTGQWKEARTKALEQENNEMKTKESGQKNHEAALEPFQQQEDTVEKVKAVKEDSVVDECKNEFNVEQEACGQKKHAVRSKVAKAKDAYRLKGHEKKVQVGQEVCGWEQENEKNFGLAQQYTETEKKLTGVYEPEKHENLVQIQRKEDTFEIDLILKEKSKEQKLKEANQRMEMEKKLEGSCKNKESERRHNKAFEKEEKEKRLSDGLEQGKKEKRLKEVFEQNENEKKLNVAREIEVDEKVKEALEQVEKDKRLKEASEQEENDKRLKNALQREENENGQKGAPEHEENEKKQREDHKREGNEKVLKEVDGMEDKEERLKEACEQEDDMKSFEVDWEREQSETRLKETAEQEETYNKSREYENRVKISDDKQIKELSKVQEQTKRVDELKFPKQTCVCMEGDSISIFNEKIKLDDVQNPQSVGKHEENNRKLQATQQFHAHEIKGNIRTESKYCERKSVVVEIENTLVDESFKASIPSRGNLEHEDNQFRVEDSKESRLWDANVKKVGEASIGIGQTRVKKMKIVVSPTESDPEYQERKFNHNEKEKTIKQVQVDPNQDENKGQFMSTQISKEGAENMRKVEPCLQQKLGAKKNNPNTNQQVNNVSQNTERNNKILNETVKVEDTENEMIKKERALEKDRLRKMEEEREREREREKDRMAVDRATLEACERAHTESRDRAEKAAVERATADFRQKALTEARERLEKACAEAREKSLSEKVSMEIRLRAERAAVDRATAEARERAVEKATTEKASFETRERVTKSTSSRNTGLRQSYSSSDLQDIHFQSTGSSNSRYPYSAVYGASSFTERSEGDEGESVQRCRARFERHRRTAERAAKALAEKNMRDILAQREQAERNRFAETLDADVKRWSSGKEGNLRALLSTLQYILGPDSGWQPVPLTEVITAAAVKKAYRKATLCVHPDKLQQRRANIQQKYICEKVFDLLKEAWSGFNSEER